jgi:meprin B
MQDVAFRTADEEKKIVLNAMRFLESETCVRFVEWSFELQYIEINKEDKGCFAMVGRRPLIPGPYPVNLQVPGCMKHNGTVQHELLHVLGLYHEQSRPDRDDYVTIFWDNIEDSELSTSYSCTYYNLDIINFIKI